MNGSDRLRFIMSLAAIAALVVTVLVVELPADSRLWREIQNSGHALLFGAMAIAMLAVIRSLIGRQPTGSLAPYLAAGGITVLTGAATELAQLLGSRDADPFDLLIDTVGTIAFLGLYSTIDRNTRAFWSDQKHRTKTVIRIGCISLLLAVFMSPAVWAVAQTYRNIGFPTISSFDSFWANLYVSAQDAELDVVSPPATWSGEHGRSVARLKIIPADYPGILIEEPFPDWSNFEYFCFAVFLELDSTINLTLRLDDFHHNGNYEDRFNEQIVVNPGENLFRIPLIQIREAPLNRDIDLKSMASIRLFASNPTESFTVFLDDFHLE